MLLFIRNSFFCFSLPLHSNTSHVTLYLLQTILHPCLGIFKYISCYSLSLSPLMEYLLFGYSNTSHVTLYRYREKIDGSSGKDSNTSHVTLYPGRLPEWTASSLIQIHLMLLFIYTFERNKLDRYKFKYISCYSLS